MVQKCYNRYERCIFLTWSIKKSRGDVFFFQNLSGPAVWDDGNWRLTPTDLKTKHVKTLTRCGNALSLNTSRWNWSNHNASVLCDEEFAALIFPELLEIEELKSYLPNSDLQMHFRILKSIGELFTIPHHCCARYNGSLSVSLNLSAHGLVIVTLHRRIRRVSPWTCACKGVGMGCSKTWRNRIVSLRTVHSFHWVSSDL